MLLHFTKMHGLGNDFMVVDLVTQRARLREEHIHSWLIVALGLVLISCWWLSRPATPRWTSATVFSMPTEVKWRTVATALAALRALCATSA